jgi:sporulation protein YlmC with PRC-barrel domain
MASEEIRLRSDLLGTMVVTRDTGKKLGVISQLWVDIDQQEVVALSLRPNILYGTPQPMLLGQHPANRGRDPGRRRRCN